MADLSNNTDEEDLSCLPKHIHEFDAAVLNDLVNSDLKLFRKFALMFIGSFETSLVNIESALEFEDRTELCEMGHRAKSTARNIGAMALGHDCETLERIAKSADIDEIKRLALGLRQMFEVIRHELSRRINPPEHGF